MSDLEIDEGTDYTSFDEALAVVRQNTAPVRTEELPVGRCAGYVSTDDVYAVISNPATDVSMKDGFAVRSADIAATPSDKSDRLKVIGSVFAGGASRLTVLPGQAVQITSGAVIPEGADAVVASELCDETGDYVCVHGDLQAGQNIIPAGDNVQAGMKIIEKGQVISPGVQSLAATGGIGTVTVYGKPTFALLSIGDELAEPGIPLADGQIYASNLVYNGGWLTYLGIPFDHAVVRDDAGEIEESLVRLAQDADAIITSGGVMHSERDLIVGVLNNLGWEIKFRHVRMGPGKATAFGILNGKPVFCFSGGPGSNMLSFVQFALTGIYRMFGRTGDALKTLQAQLAEDMKSRNQNWTEFRDGLLEQKDGVFTVTPVKEKSRFRTISTADCLIVKPEGTGSLKRGETVTVQLLPYTE